MSMDDCCLNEVVERSLRLVRGEAAARGCEIAAELDPDLPPAPLDRLKVGQVFVNLFLNSLHAMRPGGLLAVRTRSRKVMGGADAARFPPGSVAVVAEIEDTGTGIPPDRIGRVFEPFFTTKPTGEGSGLGLTVSRSIVEMHGGTIELENRPDGKGARATVTFKASDG
jgi:signal transduction histidine kinase